MGVLSFRPEQASYLYFMSFALSILEYQVEKIEIFVRDVHTMTQLSSLMCSIIVIPTPRIILEHFYKMKTMK